MAPTVLRQTPHDANLLDRTGIIAASQPEPGDSLSGAAGSATGRGVNRSGAASMVATVLMFVVAFSVALDVQRPDGPVGGGAAREPVVIAAPPSSVEEPRQQGGTPATKDVPAKKAEKKNRPEPAPAPAAAPEPDSTVVAAPEAQPEPEVAAAPSSPQADDVVPEARSVVPEARDDLPQVDDQQGTWQPRMRQLIKPMLDLYQQSMRSQGGYQFYSYEPRRDSGYERWGYHDQGW